MAARSLGALVLVAAGCGGSGMSTPPDACVGLCSQTVVDVPVEPNRNLDLLFVIDNSGSLDEKQLALATAFDQLVQVLANWEGGLPSLHVGVVTSDVGISPFQSPGCIGNGDDGVLQNVARGACTPPTDAFISDVLGPGDTRVTNYPDTTTLSEVFRCISLLGSTGCGFEQHLESMKRGLDGHRPENAGFLRNGEGGDPNAYLAVIILADEDDCSASDGTMFDPSQDNLSDPLGPFGSYRCTEFGVWCNGAVLPRAPGEYTDCEPAPTTASSYMQHPDHYVDFLEQLKGGDGHLFVAGIIGDPTPVKVTLDFDGNPQLDCSCGCGAPSTSAPGVRLSYFVQQFAHGFVTSACNDDLGAPLAAIGDGILDLMGDPCLQGRIPDPSTCAAFDVSGTTETPIPSCAASGGALPCFTLILDPAQCGDELSQLRLAVSRDTTPPPDTHVIVRCLVEI